MQPKTALLIVDMQHGLLEDEPAYRKEETLNTVQDLLKQARQKHIPVIYMQDKDVGAVGSPAWQIHSSITPAENDLVLRKAETDSFYETPLNEQFQARNINQLIIVGMKTEMCVDMTCRRAHELGYQVILVSDGHTTTDRPYMTAEQVIMHHNWLLACIGTEEHHIRVQSASDITFK